jgi:hypothetical protein
MSGRLPNESTKAWLERLIGSDNATEAQINGVRTILETEGTKFITIKISQ